MRRSSVRGGVRRRDAPSILTWRTAVIVAIVIVAALTVTLPTIGLVFATRAPTIAVAFWPWGAASNAAYAAGLMSGEVSDDGILAARARHARTLAIRALEREPINAMAAGAIAIADGIQGHKAAAQRALAYGERLSRRDLPTQLVLIQRAVSRGDVAGALVHYDRALRTTARAADFLFPTLVVAADQPSITPSLARLLATRPIWWLPFTLQLVQQAHSPVALVMILNAERLRMTVPLERQVAVTGMKRLVAIGRVDLAGRLNDGWQARPQGLLVNADFSRPAPFPPFDWELTGGDGGGATIEDAPDGGRALLLASGDSAGDGVVAHQLVRLLPGRYRLAMRTEGVSAQGAKPTMSVVCTTGATLASTVSPAASGNARTDALSFAVPTDCPAQWIELGSSPGSDVAAPPPLIRAISLTPDLSVVARPQSSRRDR